MHCLHKDKLLTIQGVHRERMPANYLLVSIRRNSAVPVSFVYSGGGGALLLFDVGNFFFFFFWGGGGGTFAL